MPFKNPFITSSSLSSFFLISLLFHLQNQLLLAQWSDKRNYNDEEQKWPQNYPGAVHNGGNNIRTRHYPWEDGNNNDVGNRAFPNPRYNQPPPYFPGHVRHREYGDGNDNNRGDGSWRHYNGAHRDHDNAHNRWENRKMEEANEEKESNRSWFDRLLDWIFPWRWERHQSPSPTTTPTTTATTPMAPSAESDKEKEFRRRHRTHANETVIVRISGGPIRGLVSYAGGRDRPAHVYRGIPFAEPPLRELRFSPLRRKRSWEMPVDATKYKAACLSNTTRTRSPQHYISEDCIYMNVFADPKCKEQSSTSGRRANGCPVLFYVHGGGFAYDSATMFNDTQIVQKYASDGVIFMIPAYRLGVFGFLDLGNDRTVKRNLGMHDIIFALEWARREIPAFGGDPNRITIMGNSAGASAVNYLCSSPAVKTNLFKQAIISSGVPFFTPNANLEQSFALLDEFNCLRDIETNWTLSDQEKVECMRAVDSLDLLREQQHNEDWGIEFSGPEKDTEILPADNYVDLLKYWKPRLLLYLTTTHEFGRFRWIANDSNLVEECVKALTPFGYTSPQAFNACMARYNETFDIDVNMRVTYESMHAEAFLTSLVNTRLGGISYVGEFELANYSNHADDMYFFFGLHSVPLNTSDVVMMDTYYPRMIKNFLHGHAPDPDWQPQDWNGRNYFRIAFNVSTNGTLLEWPHEVDSYQDVQGLDFWLRQMANIERDARLEALNESNWWNNRTNSRNTSGPRTWQEVFGDGNNDTYPRMMRPYHTELPALHSLIAIPPAATDGVEEEGEEAGQNPNGTYSDISTGQGAVAPGPQSIGAGLLAAAPPAEESMNNPDDVNASTSPLAAWETAGNELGRVWSAYWVTMTIAVLLAVALVMMVATKMVYRYKNTHGYHPTSMDNNTPNGGGMFTEKTRIIQANDNNAARYM